MDQRKFHKQLVERYVNNTATNDELEVLNELTRKAELDEMLMVNMQENWQLEEAAFEQGLNRSDIKTPAPKFKLWSRIGIAASIAVAVMVGSYYYSSRNQPTPIVAYQNDIAPGKNGATLTLANGQKILINAVQTGKIAQESGVKITKTADGQIVYVISSEQSGNAAIQYNTLSTTRGEQTQVRLPDGTLVFLNAESSLRFPTSFMKLEKRQVELTGEGYFEVAKDKTHPFVVQTDEQEIEVLGTHFNVNAYTNEANTKTTLVEGSVKVLSRVSKSEIILKPGQQSTLEQGNSEITQANINEALAWKNGEFRFDNKSIVQIMKQIARWYDVTVEFEGEVPDGSLAGAISRSRKLSQVLKMMEKTKEVKFRIDGRKIYVEKYN